MTFAPFRQNLLSITVFEWVVVLITVIAFAAITTPLGILIGPMVGYAVVILVAARDATERIEREE